jgi:hypothetical protein
VTYGELLDCPDGCRVGEFYTNGLETPFGTLAEAASNLEFQTFQLQDGTLFGIGTTAAGSDRAFAVLGGTGRFAGARGSYVQHVSDGPVGREAVDFTLTLTV